MLGNFRLIFYAGYDSCSIALKQSTEERTCRHAAVHQTARHIAHVLNLKLAFNNRFSGKFPEKFCGDNVGASQRHKMNPEMKLQVKNKNSKY